MQSNRAITTVLVHSNQSVGDGERTFHHALVRPQSFLATEMELRPLQNFSPACFTYSHYIKSMMNHGETRTLRNSF